MAPSKPVHLVKPSKKVIKKPFKKPFKKPSKEPSKESSKDPSKKPFKKPFTKSSKLNPQHSSKIGNRASPYGEASNLVNELLSKPNLSLKSLAFGSSKKESLKCTTSSYATVCKVLQHKSKLDLIMKDPDIQKGVRDCRNTGLVYVMLHELLYSKFQRIRGGGVIKRKIMKCEDRLRELMEESALLKSSDVADVIQFPRYVRVNTLSTTREKVVQSLLADEPLADTMSIFADCHVPNLLVLPPKINLHSHSLVTDGSIILQDKSSCFSALALINGAVIDNDEKAYDVIDACAAPGNKTSHLAALLSEQLGDDTPQIKSKIFAIERDERRFSILSQRMEDILPSPTSTTNVEIHPLHKDFLQLDPADAQFAGVKAILLDPSCSGSGIVNQPMIQHHNEERIQSISNFQQLALKHALSFPQAQKVVYSTCSIHHTENENVVQQILKEANEFLEGGDIWQIHSPDCFLKPWERRGEKVGSLTKLQADCLIRCNGKEGDDTNGFFVCLFIRTTFLDQLTDIDCIDNEKDNELIPFYNGEFKPLQLPPPPPKPTIAKEEKVSPTEGKNTKKGGKQSKSDSSPSDKKDTRSIKKKEKAMKWKKSQQELKSKRIGKKKTGTEKVHPLP